VWFATYVAKFGWILMILREARVRASKGAGILGWMDIIHGGDLNYGLSLCCSFNLPPLTNLSCYESRVLCHSTLSNISFATKQRYKRFARRSTFLGIVPKLWLPPTNAFTVPLFVYQNSSFSSLLKYFIYWDLLRERQVLCLWYHEGD
jgi:hypothetical protein